LNDSVLAVRTSVDHDLIYRKYWYIVFNIDKSYPVVEKNINFVDMSRYSEISQYFLCFHNICCRLFREKLQYAAS